MPTNWREAKLVMGQEKDTRVRRRNIIMPKALGDGEFRRFQMKVQEKPVLDSRD